MAGPVFGFHPHSFGDPSDHCVVPFGTQKAALPGRGPLVFRFKVPPTFNIANIEAPVNVRAPSTTDGERKDVDALASGSSSMAAHSVRNTDIIPVLSTQKPNIADEVAVPVMPVERKRRQIIRLKVAAPKNTTTEAALPESEKEKDALYRVYRPINQLLLLQHKTNLMENSCVCISMNVKQKTSSMV
ncbi:hypothetical protein SLEP1_g8524 [Rubroshorea leprosula]|uniref:Uncharacterized protein n=1 Tax=Rubroshorea leprosula TaxID=152421 RepID=A0AAV5ID13_9ROSI|nr:hypothetical protein SLEP1_g8524 [Rubroshorea leprosula]